jgi:hypothetical protein
MPGHPCYHHGVWRHPADLGTADVERCLNDLVTRRRLSAFSQSLPGAEEGAGEGAREGAGAVAAGVGYNTSRVPGRVFTGGPLRTEVEC